MISVRSHIGHLYDVRAWAFIKHHSLRRARKVKTTRFVTTEFFNAFVPKYSLGYAKIGRKNETLTVQILLIYIA